MKSSLLISLLFPVACCAQGTFTLGQQTTFEGLLANRFTVACPSLPTITGCINVQGAGDKGTVALFSGNSQTDWWQKDNSTPNLPLAFIQNLVNAGIKVVQISWGSVPPGVAPIGVASGQVALAAREATVLRWIQDNIATHPLSISGQSGGASAACYAVDVYGVTPDRLVLTSGPPKASLDKGCSTLPGYAFTSSLDGPLDLAYGFQDRSCYCGPCMTHDPSWAYTFQQNSNAPTAHPNIQITIITGAKDNPITLNHIADYLNAMTAIGQPFTHVIVSTMGHPIQQSQDGLNALFGALTQ